MRRSGIAALLAVLAVAAGCSGADRDAGSGSASVRQAAVSPPGALAAPATPEAVPPGLPGAAMFRWNGGGGFAWPVDAATVQDLPAANRPYLRPPVIASPDGRLLANGGGYEIIDVHEWRVIRAIEGAPRLQHLRWTADGSTLLGWHDHCRARDPGGACREGRWDRALWRIDVESGAAEPVVDLDFVVVSAHVAADGRHTYALGIRTDQCCLIDPQGDPFVALIDVEARAVSAEIPLPGLLVGQPRHWLGDTSVYASYSPATALAPDGTQLYVAGSTEERVTIIDLERGRIGAVVALDGAPSRLTRFASWLRSRFLRVAEAKGGPRYDRQLAISGDGRYLFLSGRIAEPSVRTPGYAHALRSAGLTVLDTSTMEVVLREPGIGRFAITPDGRWLVAIALHGDADGARVLDLQSFEFIHHVVPNRPLPTHDVAVSPDSRYAYLTTGTVGGLVSVLDLERGEIIVRRALEADHGIIWLAPQR